MRGCKNFPPGTSIKDFIIIQGEFIYNQLISLDETSKKNDQIFKDLHTLAALREESKKHGSFVSSRVTTSDRVLNTSLKIGDYKKSVRSSSSACQTEQDQDIKLAKLLQEEEYWQSMKQKKCQHPVALLGKYYIKINEDDIANDYPLPAFYESGIQETDEYFIFNNDMDTTNPEDLPHNMLHNWSLYNLDSRMISLELLPMKSCADNDNTIYGSGIMTADDGSGFNLDADPRQSSSTGFQNVEGIPIYLSAVEAWRAFKTLCAMVRTSSENSQACSQYYHYVSIISFGDVIRRISENQKDHPAFISSNQAAVERYVVVHGQILLQQFAEFPDNTIRKYAFVTGLQEKMEERHHTKWLLKKKVLLKKEVNMNQRATMQLVESRRKAMPATITKLINRIWGEYYSNYLPELKETDTCGVKEDEEIENEQENGEDFKDVEGEKIQVDWKNEKPHLAVMSRKSLYSNEDVKWDAEMVGRTSTGEALYKQAYICQDLVTVGSFVLLETVGPSKMPSIYFLEYMYEKKDGRKIVHGRLMLRGFQTVLGNVSSSREVYLTHHCLNFELEDVKEAVLAEIQLHPWGYQHRKDNANKDKTDRDRADKRKRKGLSMEYYCRSLYWPERGAFFRLPLPMGLGTGVCSSCSLKETQREKETFKINLSRNDFTFRGTEYYIHDYVYLAPQYFETECKDRKTFKGGRNIGLKTYVVCQLGEIEVATACKQANPESTNVKVRRFFRPEDISMEKAYSSDIQEVYYSEQTLVVPIVAIEGKCENRLATLDIFAGCGGLSEGLQKAGVSQTKWAIEYEEPAGEAFKLNHPEAMMFVENCNVILRAIMSEHGDVDDCIATPEAAELAAKLDKEKISNLPYPGEVEFINGGPPCQGFSGMNRFNQSTWSKVQCEMILSFLSFADYFRPRFSLLENVRNFVSFNKGQTFRLTLASLLEMGYQVRFGILEAGGYGVSQSCKRAFIWAASPEETLPEWPEPMHVFAGSELKVNLSGNSQYAAVRSTANGAPFCAITVRDAIGDLPAVGNAASLTTIEYKNDPVSWFQKNIRRNMLVLTDHISKEMNELNLIRCQRIPRCAGADWHDLPEEKVRFSTGQTADLIPWYLPNTAKRHNQWKGLFGRLDWEGNFPTSVTDPQPTGKVGMCFHPDQDRIITVRECARSQGFPDSYKFAGNIQHKHRQIGNAVPPPLAFALGRKLKEAIETKCST
ncbi:hypothetical protein CRYUN_Cryun34aG0110000 [Craigia yunnanensis]